MHSGASQTRCHALTVDVEDYFHVTAFEGLVSREMWAEIPSRVVPNTQRLLALFAAQGVKATFFVLGWVAERFPQLVRDIDTAGHEIASHSYWHQRIFLQSPSEFREDLRRSRDVLGAITGKTVTAYRAPTFSITNRSLWALDILADEGFRVDSSIFPIRHDRYGIADAPTIPHTRETDHGPILEFPASVLKLAKWNCPIAGGGYFRLAPWRMTKWAWERAEQESAAPQMFYIHPWELDPQQPRIAGASVLKSWRHRNNLHTTADKLAKLLANFKFGTLTAALASAGYDSDLTNARDLTSTLLPAEATT
jgi:polysaccharide deacetylase family protein (PEP-CTERM system associated)